MYHCTVVPELPVTPTIITLVKLVKRQKALVTCMTAICSWPGVSTQLVATNRHASSALSPVSLELKGDRLTDIEAFNVNVASRQPVNSCVRT